MDSNSKNSVNNIPVIRKPTIVHVDNTSMSNRDAVFNDLESSFFQKYKLYLIGGTILIALIVSLFLFMSQSPTPTTTPESGGAGRLDGGEKIDNKSTLSSSTVKNTNQTEQDYSEEQKKLLTKVWTRTVSGQSIIYSGSGTTTQIGLAWVDKLTGNVYKAYEPDWKAIRITNTTISNTINAVFLNNGNTVVMQQYNQNSNSISTIVADIPRTNEGSGDSLDNMSNLSENIESVTASDDGTSLFMVVGTLQGSAIYKMDATEKKPILITTSAMKDLEVKYLDKDSLIIYQKPAATLKTSVYILSLKSKQLNLKYNDYGITAIGYKGKFMYSSVSNTYTESAGQKVKRYNNTIVSDKCSIASSAAYAICANPKDLNSVNLPDDWYDYSYYTNDNLVLYGLDYEEYNTLLDLSLASGAAFDVDSVSISNNSNYVGLSNRYGSLYVFNLGAASN